MATTITQPTQEEEFQLQHAINEHINQKDNLHKLFIESSLTYEIDTSGMKNYDFNAVDTSNMTGGESKLEFSKKIKAFKTYFDDNFKQNTKILQQYRNNIDTVNKDLEEQGSKLKELVSNRKSLSIGNSTNIRKLKDSKRELAKQEYYQHLYIVVGLSQLVNLLILGLMMNGNVPKMTGLVITFIIVLALTIYVIYYIFFKEPSRDVVSFDKYKFEIDKEYTAKLPGCPVDVSKKRKSQEKELQDKINNILQNDEGECEVRLTDDIRDDYLNKYTETTKSQVDTTTTSAN